MIGEGAPIIAPRRLAGRRNGPEVGLAPDSLLEESGFEPSVPLRGQHFFESTPEPGEDKPAQWPEPDCDDYKGRFTVALPGLASAMISTPGYRTSGRRQRWECQPSRFSGLTRPALGDGVLPRRYA